MEGRLIVENFGPIKKVDIQLNKLMVLIGPQSGGKSTIAKLLAIFVGMKPRIESSKLQNTHRILTRYFEHKLEEYNIKWSYDNSRIEYVSENSAMTVVNGKVTYEKREADTVVIYVPAERIFTSMASGAIYSLQKNEIPIPYCVIDFGANFEVSRSKLGSFKVKELGVTYRYENGNDLLELENQSTIKLKEGSSGYQTMIPMAMVVEYFSRKKGKEDNTNSIFIVEEPELNLYPITQKQLVDFLGERCVNDKNSLLVTTHSPYILSAFANLIKANEVAKLSEEKKAKIKKVVPEKYWIDYDETSAYFIDKGVSKNIMDKKFKTIDFSQIDKASDVIGNEFDKLLTIEVED